ncbi:MAG: class I tRNA ligase family protein, partial [Candidatus Nanohaloarchaea archaeon]|nr:class I tRNA ligase family protein [Candidatus Nanohaloarchaea archaeon]
DCGEPVMADEDRLPVDPSEDEPQKSCPECGNDSFEPEEDVMDTWFTSSLTPLINARWQSDDSLLDDIYPMDLRPQGYDIIRTWAFYTILKSHFHTGSRPWDDIMVSGMAKTEDGRSFSKSRGIVVKPRKVVDKYSADALRWWSSKVKLGEDLRYREDDLVAGEKLVTKLWNVARFLNNFIDGEPSEPDEFSAMDRWILQRRDETVEEATGWFEVYEYDRSKELTKQFFWHDIADNYLEIAKQSLYEEDAPSALYVLYHTFLDTIKLLAPVLPFVTEEIYHRLYADRDEESIHVSSWPEVQEYGYEREKELGDTAIEVIGALRKYKTRRDMSLNESLDHVTVFGSRDLAEFRDAIRDAMHVDELEVREEMPAMEERIDEVSLDYARLGPRYGDQVKEIEEAVATPDDLEIEDGTLELDLDGETVELEEGEDFEVSRSYTLSDARGELVEAENVAVVVR